jgi:hypothetical protein
MFDLLIGQFVYSIGRAHAIRKMIYFTLVVFNERHHRSECASIKPGFALFGQLIHAG